MQGKIVIGIVAAIAIIIVAGFVSMPPTENEAKKIGFHQGHFQLINNSTSW